MARIDELCQADREYPLSNQMKSYAAAPKDLPLINSHSYYQDTLQAAPIPDNTFSKYSLQINRCATVSVHNTTPPEPAAPRLREELDRMIKEDSQLFRMLIECFQLSRSQASDQGILNQDIMMREQTFLKIKQKEFLALQEKLQQQSKYVSIGKWISSILLGATILASLVALSTGIGAGLIPGLSAAAKVTILWISAGLTVMHAGSMMTNLYSRGRHRKFSELGFESQETCKKIRALINHRAKCALDQLKRLSEQDKSQKRALDAHLRNAKINY